MMYTVNKLEEIAEQFQPELFIINYSIFIIHLFLKRSVIKWKIHTTNLSETELRSFVLKRMYRNTK